MALLSRITPEQLEDYMRFKITSADLAKATGYAAPYIRRSIKRERPQTQGRINKVEKQEIAKARRAYHASIAHLPANQIMKQARVSQATAFRIKQRYKVDENVQ